MTLRARMRGANTGIAHGEARLCLYWVRNMGQGLGQTQVLVFTSFTRFSSLSNFAISTAGPFCTSCPFFSWGRDTVGMGKDLLQLCGSCHGLLFPPCPSCSLTLPCPVNIGSLLGLRDSEAQLRACEEDPL